MGRVLFLRPGGLAELGASYVLPSGSGYGNVTIYSAYKGQLDLNGFNATINGLLGDGLVINSAAGASSLTVGEDNVSSTFAGTIQGSAGPLALGKIGSGTLTLSGASTYSGGTTVGWGTLLVNNATGSGTGSGAVRVYSGGSLGGTGTINGPTTVYLGGTLAPGPGGNSSIGALTFGSSLKLDGVTSMAINKAPNRADEIVMTSGNTVTLGGTLFVPYLGSTALVAGDTFQLVVGAMAGTFNSFDLPALPAGLLVWDTSQLTPGGNGTVTVRALTPQIFSFSPNSGNAPQSLMPGSTVYINGSGFAAGSQVMFGNTNAVCNPTRISQDGTEIQAQVPRYATTGNLCVLLPGFPNACSAQPFTVNCYRNTCGFAFENDCAFQDSVHGYTCGVEDTALFGSGQTEICACLFGNCVCINNPMADLFVAIANALLGTSCPASGPGAGQCFGFSLASQRLMHGQQPYSVTILGQTYQLFPLPAGLDQRYGVEPPRSE